MWGKAIAACCSTGAYIDFLKIDAEGSEGDILHGAEFMLSTGRIKTILLESYEKLLLKFGYTSMQLADYIKSYGYKVYSITHQGLEKMPKDISDTNLLCIK